MKKVKWSVWFIVFLVKSIVDFVVFFEPVGLINNSTDYSNVESLGLMAVRSDIILGAVVLLGTLIMIKKIFSIGNFEIKYKFWSMAVFSFFISAINLLKGLFIDFRIADIARITGKSDRMFCTAMYFLLGVVFVLIADVMGLVKQISFNNRNPKYRKESNESVQ